MKGDKSLESKDESNMLEANSRRMYLIIVIILFGVLLGKILYACNVFRISLAVLIALSIMVCGLVSVILSRLSRLFVFRLPKERAVISKSEEYKPVVELYLPPSDRITQSSLIKTLTPFILALVVFYILVPYIDPVHYKKNDMFILVLISGILLFYFSTMFLRMFILKRADEKLKKIAVKHNLNFIGRDPYVDSCMSGRVDGIYAGMHVGVAVYAPNLFQNIPFGYTIRLLLNNDVNNLLITPKRMPGMADIPSTLMPYLSKKPNFKVTTGFSNFDRKYDIFCSKKDCSTHFLDPKLLKAVLDSGVGILIKDKYITSGRHGLSRISDIERDLQITVEIAQKIGGGYV